jgi:photosystem II stability/assembly factor-like uncharacterized protein
MVSAFGCTGLPQVTNVEEDGQSIFCTFYHYRYPGEDQGTLRSTDDGITWTRIYPGGDGRDAVYVCRCRAGLLAELDDRSWSISTDGGTSWEPVMTLQLEESRMSGPTGRGKSEEIYLGLSTGVMRSTDGGKTWAPADTSGLGNSDIFSIAATSSAVIIIASPQEKMLGNWYSKGPWGYYRSSDSGRSWKRMTDIGIPGFCSVLASDSTFLRCASPWFWYQHRYREGWPGPSYRSDDNGNSWTQIDSLKVIEILECDTSLLAYVQTDSGGALLVSTNAGLTWNSQGGPPTPSCNFIQAYPSGTGIFGYNRESPDGTFYRSRDCGRTWDLIRMTGF